MPTIMLDQTYILHGKFYGPGAADVDDATHASLTARMAALAPKDAAPSAAEQETAAANLAAEKKPKS